MKKFDSRWSAPNRPLFRFIAFLLCIPCLLMGLMYVIFGIISIPFEFDNDLKFGISATFFGILFFFVAIRKRLPEWLDNLGYEKDKKLFASKKNIRNHYSKWLLFLLLPIFLSIVLFLSFEIFSFFWWLSIIFILLALFILYTTFSLHLIVFGYHPLLSLTVIFPVWLFVSIIIWPEKFYRIDKA